MAAEARPRVFLRLLCTKTLVYCYGLSRNVHACCAGHVFFHLRELLDVLDRSMQPTVDCLEAPDRVLFIPR